MKLIILYLAQKCHKHAWQGAKAFFREQTSDRLGFSYADNIPYSHTAPCILYIWEMSSFTSRAKRILWMAIIIFFLVIGTFHTDSRLYVFSILSCTWNGSPVYTVSWEAETVTGSYTI